MEGKNSKTKAQLIKELEAARKRLSDLDKYSFVEKSNDGIVILQDGLIKFANVRASQIYGFPVEETISKPFLDYIAPASRGNVQETYIKRLRGEKVPDTYETALLNASGNNVPVEINASLIEYAGKPATLAIIRNISEREKYAESLKASEEKFRSIFNNSGDGIAVYHLDNHGQPGPFIEVNPILCEWLGYSRDELMSLTPNLVTKIGKDEPSIKDTIVKLKKKGKATVERTLIGKNDGEISVEVSGHIIDFQGKPAIISILRNIDERKRADVLLRESELKFKTLAEKSPNMVFINRAGRIVYANQLCEELMEYKLADLYDKEFNFLNLVAAKDIGKIKRNFARHASGQEVVPVEYTLVTKSGKKIECILSTKLIDYGDSKAILGVVTDISDRKQAEQELKIQASMLDAIIEMIFVHDFDGNITFVNDAAAKATGYSTAEMLKMNIIQISDPETVRLTESRILELKQRKELTFEAGFVNRDGSSTPIEVHARVTHIGDRDMIISIVRDLSDRKRLQSQVILQDRLASVGQFVSGIAHELNNPLTSVIGFSELLLQKDLPEDIREDLTIICSEAQRTSTIIKHLLTFARQHPQEKQPMLIHDPIRAVMRLRAHEQRLKNVEIQTNFGVDLPFIKGNDSQLQQVFFNLITNAEFAAMESGRKGTIIITTEHVKGHVRVSMKDNGRGISADNMKRLFSPFFTTKEPGKGTGLGLSICQGIISEHGGRIWAESEHGKGAEFFVELPVYPNP